MVVANSPTDKANHKAEQADMRKQQSRGTVMPLLHEIRNKTYFQTATPPRSAISCFINIFNELAAANAARFGQLISAS